MSARKIASTIVFLGILGALAFGISYLTRSRFQRSDREQTIKSGTPAPLPSFHVSSPAAGSSPSVSRPTGGRESSWRDFQTRFGDRLEGRFSPSGNLVSVRGGVDSRKSSGRFDPSDPQQAIKRAKEVLAAASGLLGLDPNLPLEKPFANASAASAQVFFRETYDGVPVMPEGNVTVDLGPEGQLLGLDSNYVPGVQATNPVSIQPEEARSRAIGAVSNQSSSLRVEGGNPVVWVPGPGFSGQARRAYAYTVQGYQVIVDASDGKILSRRDKRQY